MVVTNMENKAVVKQQFHGGSMAKTYLMEKYGTKFVRKYAFAKDKHGIDKLKSQWQWLFDFQQSNAMFFPKVSFFTHNKESAYYDMEYVEQDSLRDMILKEEQMDYYLFDEVVRMLRYISSTPSPFHAPIVLDSYIKINHLDKMTLRMGPAIANDWVKSPLININGKHNHNLLHILDKIENDKVLMKFLRPKAGEMVRSHGDYTFQNMLTDGNDITLIDPRGEGPDSIYYDISKLFQSCHGMYDLLVEKNYNAQFERSDDNEFSITYKIYDHTDKMEAIYESFLELIPEVLNLEEDWKLKALFYEASHFISMFPFRLKENIEITLLCYAKGIEILNEFWEEWLNVRTKYVN